MSIRSEVVSSEGIYVLLRKDLNDTSGVSVGKLNILINPFQTLFSLLNTGQIQGWPAQSKQWAT